MPDVVLVCMPFGPVFSPSLGLSLLKAGLTAQGVTCRVRYFSIDFAERVGQDFYSGVSTYGRPPHRHLAGEWIFSRALFGAAAPDDEAYVEEVLRRPNPASSDRPVSEALVRRIRAAREQAEGFLDWCLEELLRDEPHLVGFTSVFHQHVASLGLARRLKEARPDCFVVLGGANCEGPMGAETVRQFPFVDATVSGEGDVVFPELVARVFAGRPVGDLPGVRTRAVAEGPLASSGPTAPMVRDMDALPVPDYEDYFAEFGQSRYAKEWQPSIFFETSRGCWWGERMHCTFCGLNGSTMAFRSKSATRAIEELTSLTMSHPGCDVQLVDNILDLSYFKDFLPALADRKLDLDLFYETKSNLRKDQVRLLRRAGIRKIQPGIESLSDAVLKLMQKGVSALQNIQLLKWSKELGVEPHWNVIWGFPGEDPAEYERMAALVPLLSHLPPPRAFGSIRLDRFSPNFYDAERRGFTEVAPLPPYRLVYPLSDDALRNLAYFFSFGYKEPRDVAAYVRPLARRLTAWQREARRSELVWGAAGAALVLLDSRPAAPQALTVLHGVDRTIYEACDAVATLAGVAASVERAGLGRRNEAEIGGRLEPLVASGLVLRDGGRYLALAVSLAQYTPPAEAAERLGEIAQALGREGRGVRVFDPAARPSRSFKARARSGRKRSRPGNVGPSSFSVNKRGELVIRLVGRP